MNDLETDAHIQYWTQTSRYQAFISLWDSLKPGQKLKIGEHCYMKMDCNNDHHIDRNYLFCLDNGKFYHLSCFFVYDFGGLQELTAAIVK